MGEVFFDHVGVAVAVAGLGRPPVSSAARVVMVARKVSELVDGSDVKDQAMVVDDRARRGKQRRHMCGLDGSVDGSQVSGDRNSDGAVQLGAHVVHGAFVVSSVNHLCAHPGAALRTSSPPPVASVAGTAVVATAVVAGDALVSVLNCSSWTADNLFA